MWINLVPVENRSIFSTPPVEAVFLVPQVFFPVFHIIFSYYLLLLKIQPLLPMAEREKEIGGTVYEIFL